MPNQFTPKRPVVHVIGPSIAYVTLTKGYFSCIEKEDADDAGKYCWCYCAKGTGYAMGMVNGKYVYLHRWIAGFPDSQVDHQNMSSLDNRRNNLREANFSQQRCNQGIRGNNKSGYKGVFWDKNRGLWRVKVQYEGKQYHASPSKTALEAAEKRNAIAEKIHGEFARQR